MRLQNPAGELIVQFTCRDRVLLGKGSTGRWVSHSRIYPEPRLLDEAGDHKGWSPGVRPIEVAAFVEVVTSAAPLIASAAGFVGGTKAFRGILA